MAVGGIKVALDPGRDTLINVNALGDPVPSARFMGGREFELVNQGHPTSATATDVGRVLAENILLLPAIEPRTGPFPGHACPLAACTADTRAAGCERSRCRGIWR